MTEFGLSETVLDSIIQTIAPFDTVEKAVIFGSRSRGDYHSGSDIDLAIYAPLMTGHEFSRLWNRLDDLPIIFTMDILHVEGLENQELLEKILQEGRVIFHK